jgi:hypothetical protein
MSGKSLIFAMVESTQMAHEIIYRFQYKPSEIYSAHRLRYLYSSQVRIIAGIALLVEIYLIAQQLFPQALRRPAASTWSTPVGVAFLLGLLPLVSYLVAPLLDYQFNPDWKKAFTLFLSKESFRFAETSGNNPGVPIKWFRVKRVLENKSVIVMLLGSERIFVIIPKRLFEDKEQEVFFREILSKKAALPTDSNA